MGVQGLPPEKFLETTPLRRSENEGNALFSYILHHQPDYIEQKIGWMFRSIWIKNLCSLYQVTKKAKEFLCNYKRSDISSTKYEMDLLSFTAKCFDAGRTILIFEELSLFTILSFSCQSTASKKFFFSVQIFQIII